MPGQSSHTQIFTEPVSTDVEPLPNLEPILHVSTKIKTSADANKLASAQHHKINSPKVGITNVSGKRLDFDQI